VTIVVLPSSRAEISVCGAYEYAALMSKAFGSGNARGKKLEPKDAPQRRENFGMTQFFASPLRGTKALGNFELCETNPRQPRYEA
jgi:hypothetical protein